MAPILDIVTDFNKYVVLIDPVNAATQGLLRGANS